MGTTSQKSSYLRETKRKIKDKIEDLGEIITNETTFRQYADKLDNIYSNLPKVPGTGTEVTLENTKAGKMVIQPKGNTSQAILPSEYQQVEYIESSGTQYIDTGLAGNVSKRVQAKLNWSSITSNDSMFIGANSGSGTSIVYIGAVLISNSKRAQFAYGNYTNMSQTIAENLNYELDAILSNGNQTVKLNEDITNNNLSTNIGSNNLYIFAMNANGTANYYSSGKLYYCKIYDTNNVLVRNLIPCYKKSNNEIGLYDIVNDVFYTNQGTGTFAKGKDVPNPNYPQEIKNVTGDNNVAIRGKNLFDINNEKLVDINSTGTQRYGVVVEAKNKNVSISGTFNGNIAYKLLTNNVYGNYVDVSSNTTIQVAEKIVIYVGANNVKLSQQIENLQIEINDTPTPYEPYITPIEKELKLSGKNKITGFYGRTTGFISYNFDNSNLTNTMTYSFIPTFALNDIVLYVRTKNSSGIYNKATFNTVANEKTSITFSLTDAELEILKSTPSIIQIYKPNSFDNSDNIAEIQLEEGSTATEYEPYYDYTLMKDDYITEDCVIHHTRKKVVFDENSNFNLAGIRTNTILFSRLINDMVNVGNVSALDLYINRFINQSVYGNDIEGIQHSTNSIYISINKSRLDTTDVTGFQTWLSNNNITLEYELETEETETIPNTIPLYNQVKELYRTIIPGGTIIVETESDEENASLIVQASALKNVESEEVNE